MEYYRIQLLVTLNLIVINTNLIEIRHLLNMILSHAKIPIQIEVDPSKVRPVDVPIIEADISKLVAATGWHPEYSLDQIIEDTLNYWRAELKK